MTIQLNHHTYVLTSGDVRLYAILMIIELLCWAYFARRWYVRKHPKHIPDPPWPKSPLTVGMRNHLDESER